MSEFEGHMPGPWTVYMNRDNPTYQINADCDGDQVIILYCDPWPLNGILRAEDKANARLIAAAPDLLAQRDALLEALEEIAVATEDAETHLTIWVADKAEAAIAKVRGGERDE